MGGRGCGGGVCRRLYTCRYTVTTRMTQFCIKVGRDESHLNDSSIKMGSNGSHFNVSLLVRDTVTRRCPQTTTFEEKGEPKQIRTVVPLLTNLTPYR